MDLPCFETRRTFAWNYYAPPRIINRRGHYAVFCCLKVDRPRKTKIGTEVTHVTRDSDTTFKVKGQGHQAALLTAALTRQAAAAMSVGTYWLWEPTATLRSALCRGGWLVGARLFGAHRGRRGRPPAYSLLLKAEWELNQQQGGEEFKCYMIWQMMVALLHSNGQLRTDRDGDTEKGCQNLLKTCSTAED